MSNIFPGAYIVLATEADNAIDATVLAKIAVDLDLTNLLAAKVPVTRTIAGHALNGNVTLAKADVGLGNVDNTSDVLKPVSNATATAITANNTTLLATVTAQVAAVLVDAALTGTPTTPTAAFGDNDATVASTAFVQANNAIPGTLLYMSCPGGVQPLRNTLTNRADVRVAWMMLTEPSVAAGYAIPNWDFWARVAA